MWSLTKYSCRWFRSCVVVQLGLVGSGCLTSGSVDLAGLGVRGVCDEMVPFVGRGLGISV